MLTMNDVLGMAYFACLYYLAVRLAFRHNRRLDREIAREKDADRATSA